MARPLSPVPQLSDGASPEWKLLLACARTRLDQAHRDRIRELLQGPVDWNRFISAASRHRLDSLANRHLAVEAAGAIPAGAAITLETLVRSRGRHSLLHAGRLIELVDLFRSAGVAAVPYKGPTLGALAYGSFALRSFVDLDFILPQRDLLRAARLLTAQGFQAYPDPTAAEEARFLARFHPGQYAFVSPSKQLQVELHTENTLRYLPVPLDWEGLGRRFIQVSFGGRQVQTFSVEDTLILLCVHGTKHFWERLSWICDIAELVQSPRGVDWELGQDLARRAGCRRMWLLGLSLANWLLDAPLPDNVLDWIAADFQVEGLRRQIQGRLAGEERTVRSAPQRLLFRLRSHESLAVSLRQCLRTAMGPTEEDRHTFNLPDWAAPLYLALRPWRLLREHGFGLRGRPLPDLASFIPTPREAVEELLRFAALGGGDVLYDLGCGDGRIVIAAARQFGIRAVGIDVDPRRIAEARANARRSGVEHLVEFRQQDVLEADLAPATVVTLYLSDSGILAVSGKLREQLRPGARIISRDAAIPGWDPYSTEEIFLGASKRTTTLFQWRIPQRAETLAQEVGTPSVVGRAG
ncbi:MAG TPA: nucleotidyltransferase family protein [Candidatus Acidoferrales bacterium]